MGRSPFCSKDGFNRGAWTAEEDRILTDYITTHGEGKWRNLPTRAGLKRCGKSCRLRWLNYLRPGIKRGNISPDEEELIIRLHNLLGNRWSLIAGRLPGRTDNEIKNYWNTNLAKRVKDQNNTQKNIPKAITPSIISPSPSNHNVNQVDSSSHVVRPKATKCSKVLMLVNNDPLTQPLHPYHSHSSMQIHNNNNSNYYKEDAEAEALLAGAAANNSTCSNQMETPSIHDISGLLSFPSEDGKDLSTDLLLDDFEMGEIYFSDLLNSDFSGICDFSYNNNINSHQLSPARSDQLPLLFTDEILIDWTQSHLADEPTRMPSSIGEPIGD